MTRRRRGSTRRATTGAGAGPATQPVPRPRTQRRDAGGTPPSNLPLLIMLAAAVVAVVLIVVVVRPFGGGSAAAPTGAAGTARGTNCPTSQPPPLPAGERRVVRLQTERGAIDITVEADRSPIAAGNFVALAACGFYDGVVFHRTATLPDGAPFVIQGGDPTGTGGGGPPYRIQDEPVTSAYGRGVVAMARTNAPNSVGSQFFIVLDDRARSVLESFNTYQIIGTVTAGMDVADAIHQASGGQEKPSDPVAMTDVTVSTP